MSKFEKFLEEAAEVHEAFDDGEGVSHVLFSNESGRTLIAVWDVEEDEKLPTMRSFPTYEAAAVVFNRDYR